ncbi:integrase catalytic domain-containing protein [Trichonephila clavata]|uniref:Integrase catalytic domain-containing protein n=1 Tax=Trichonephila clavata TaxID=2740835 RepID=A0A8X6IJI0_TRICU|nr:integrase catalytic domain-containing protein [Trichonephila clavata]
MNLRKWKPNSIELSQNWEENLSSLIDSLKNVKNTKRSVLRISSKLFDPIGYIAAFTIRIKILLQEIWEGGFDWDEELGKNLRTKWKKWCKEVHSLVDLSIPRYYFKTYETNEEFNEYQIVIFCDASERAYGAIAYIRYKGNSDFHVNFVSSKARVAPLKKLSLPRMELLATLIGARLLETLRKVFKITNNYILFSDSTVALSWIRGYAKQWKPFFSNRVHEIQDLTNPQNWRFVKGEQNPADIVSRGCSPEELMKNSRFWHGPHWLTLSEENWPKNERLSQETTNEERRVKYISINYSSEFQNEEPILDINDFSSISKIFRITAWIRRFINNLKLKKEDRIKTPLSAEEIEEAEEIWIKKVQAEKFGIEINCLEENKNLPKDSKIRDLNPFLNEKGILRISGRLQQSTLSYHEKHPILIPAKNRFTELLVKDAHEKMLHSGVADTLIQVREKYTGYQKEGK